MLNLHVIYLTFAFLISNSNTYMLYLKRFCRAKGITKNFSIMNYNVVVQGDSSNLESYKNAGFSSNVLADAVLTDPPYCILTRFYSQNVCRKHLMYM